VTKDALLATSGKYDLEDWLTKTRYRSTKSGFQYQKLKKKGELSVIVKYQTWSKWLLFHKWYYQQMIKDLGKTALTEYTDNTIVLKIKLD
jgi:hypothetical protein